MKGKRSRRIKEKSIEVFFLLHGFLAIALLAGIFFLLVSDSLTAFKQVRVGDFLGFRWNPTSYEEPSYGLFSMVVSTVMVTLGSLLLVVPLGVGLAAYMAELASPWLREFLKPAIETLASIPSVVVGFLGIMLLGPILSRLFGLTHGLNALNGSILLAIMALPTIVSISEDAIRAVPKEYRDASMALGATRGQTLLRVVLPASVSGIGAASMLGMGRAIGETMTVLMATGNSLALPKSLFDPVRTLTATVAIEMGEVPYGSVHYHSLFVVGLALFILTFLVNLASETILRRAVRKA